MWRCDPDRIISGDDEKRERGGPLLERPAALRKMIGRRQPDLPARTRCFPLPLVPFAPLPVPLPTGAYEPYEP